MILGKDDVVIVARIDGEANRILGSPIVLRGFESYSFIIDKRMDSGGSWWFITEICSGAFISMAGTRTECIAAAIKALNRNGKDAFDTAIKKVIEELGPLPA